ncbi:MAG: hypothetical protein ACREIC_32385, partial [Limisphaerales bacterium]
APQGSGLAEDKSGPSQEPASAEDIRARVGKFLEEIAASEEQPFPSVGLGTDLRYRSVTPAPGESGADELNPVGQASTFQAGVVGTALVHETEVIHAAFFKLNEPDRTSPMSSYLRRRRFGR